MTLVTSNSKFFTVLPPRPLENLGWEVRIYDVDNPNTLLALVPRWRGLSFTKELSAIGVGTVSVPLGDRIFTDPLPAGVFSLGLLEEANIWRIYWNGIERFAFVHNEDAQVEIATDEKGGRWATVSGPGIGGMLAWGAVFPKNWGLETYDSGAKDHVFVDETYGYMLERLFGSSQDRGTMSGMALMFDGEKDSHEQPWGTLATLNVSPGPTLADLFERWGAAEFDWYVDTDLRVYAWQDYGHHYEGTIRLQSAHQITSTEINRTRADVRNALLVEGSDGEVTAVADAPSQTRWQRREAYLTAGEAGDATTRMAIAAAMLARAAPQAVQRTLTIVPEMAGRTVFVDFDIGDWISTQGGDEDYPAKWNSADVQRVIAVSIGVQDTNSQASCELTLESRLEAAQVRMWKRLTRLIEMSKAGDAATPVAS